MAMDIFFANYKMTARHWRRLLGLSIIFNAIVCTLSFPFGLGLMLLPVALPIGLFIASMPAVITIVLAASFSALRGHFSFLQFFVIGTLVSSFLAQRLIQMQNDLILDHIFFLMRTLPVTWVGGWVVAHVLNALPEPMPAGDGFFRTPGTFLAWLVSLVLVVVTIIMLVQGASQAIEEREVARAAERRGNCPAGLECTVSAGGGYGLDPRIFAIRMDGRQFIVPANGIYLGVSNSPRTPGETDVIRLHGLLPDFAHRSSLNTKAFSYPAHDVGYLSIEPGCSAAGYCRAVPDSLRELEAKTPNAKLPIFIRTDQRPDLPAGLEYIGDTSAFSPHSTTLETADTHVYRTELEGEYILCHTADSAVSPSCEHTMVRDGLRIELRYKRSWLDEWAQIRANAIGLISAMQRANVPPNVVYVVDRLATSP